MARRAEAVAAAAAQGVAPVAEVEARAQERHGAPVVAVAAVAPVAAAPASGAWG